MHEQFDETKISSQDALEDNRSEEEQNRDYLVDEVAADVAVTPFQNKKVEKLTANIYNQWYVGSCVPHAFITQLEYEGLAPYTSDSPSLSQLRAYRKRINYPRPGSNAVDMYNKIKQGQSDDFPTPDFFTEDQATAMPYVAGSRIIDDFNYFQYKKPGGLWDVEQIVKDVAIGKAVTIFIWANRDEWAQEYVEIKDPNLGLGGAPIRHGVCLVPKGDFTENGKRWIAVHDSAKFGGRHLRYVDYEFLKKRIYMGAKIYKGAEIPEPTPPPQLGLPLETCQQGDRGDKVLALQEYLIEKGFLESKYATSFYGPITARAVLWFQLFYHDKFDSTIPELLGWKGQFWGQQSVKVVQQLEK